MKACVGHVFAGPFHPLLARRRDRRSDNRNLAVVGRHTPEVDGVVGTTVPLPLRHLAIGTEWALFGDALCRVIVHVLGGDDAVRDGIRRALRRTGVTAGHGERRSCPELSGGARAKGKSGDGDDGRDAIAFTAASVPSGRSWPAARTWPQSGRRRRCGPASFHRLYTRRRTGLLSSRRNGKSCTRAEFRPSSFDC